jgi:hypothetical protein
MAANHKKHLQQEREQRQKLAAAAAQRQRIKELAAQQREVSYAEHYLLCWWRRAACQHLKQLGSRGVLADYRNTAHGKCSCDAVVGSAQHHLFAWYFDTSYIFP